MLHFHDGSTKLVSQGAEAARAKSSSRREPLTSGSSLLRATNSARLGVSQACRTPSTLIEGAPPSRRTELNEVPGLGPLGGDGVGEYRTLVAHVVSHREVTI